ncbi:CMT1A duplicated region transcript 1 protein [Myripristis murdjan]|uniref:CMT1A duplicated region transcript 1 protein n=1 Tax=Myripristis murdjan TaxID=586833 RepID=UPI0011761EBF|nr:CMT1A duplicated region transcript 1 protein [Myripristis murdjan]
MRPARFRKCVSESDISCKQRDGHVNTSGGSQSHGFSSQWPWPAAHPPRRRFLVGLLLRCKSVQVLESIQRVLQVTSWKVFTYARSKKPNLPDEMFMSSQGYDENLPGTDMVKIWDWFSGSPDWIKSKYLCHLLSFCDTELLRLLGNLASVLLVRQRRGFLQFNAKSTQQNGSPGVVAVGTRGFSERKGGRKDGKADAEDPALMVVPGSSTSMSGVSQCRDFIRCLPVHLSKRILGLLDKHTLRCCQRVSRYWRYLARDTMGDTDAKVIFQDRIAMMKSKSIKRVSPTYANILEVLVPVKCDEGRDFHSVDQKGKPFEAAYAGIKTRTVQMEERNVYCGIYSVTMLLEKEDPHRVVDYRGGQVMAVGSKDRMLHLLSVASTKEIAPVMKGHVGSIRAVLLCEDRDLVISGGYDFSIRCWNLKTAACTAVLYGHTGTINCLDVHGDTLVSGGKDCKVRVWNLQTGKHFEDFNLKHPSSVQCVKINTTVVYSSCDVGLVKIWDMETGALLKVIDAHRSSVKCLFFDQWHLLSGDFDGQVMAWSINRDVTERLMTFIHPQEVQSLTLTYLRVITGCTDGKMRIFNFLTGDCLRFIKVGVKPNPILSMHVHDNSILVNTTSSVQLYQFAKVCWDYTESAEGGQRGVAMPQAGLVSEESSASLRKSPHVSVRVAHVAQVASVARKTHDHNRKTPQKVELSHRTRCLSAPCKYRSPANEVSGEAAKISVKLSERAASERMKKRGLHHPLMTEHILLKVNTIQKARCSDEAGMNMECNARLRDAWGSPPPQEPSPSPHLDVHPNLRSSQSLKRSSQAQKHLPCHRIVTSTTKTYTPILNRSFDKNMRNNLNSRDITSAVSDVTIRLTHPSVCLREPHHCLVSERTLPRRSDTQEPFRKVGAFTTSAKEGPQAPEHLDWRQTQQGATLRPPPSSSWVTVGSHVTASYLGLARERKQEMLAIAGLLCTLWEIMGAVQRDRDVPRAMFHITTSHPIHSCLDRKPYFPSSPSLLCVSTFTRQILGFCPITPITGLQAGQQGELRSRSPAAILILHTFLISPDMWSRVVFTVTPPVIPPACENQPRLFLTSRLPLSKRSPRCAERLKSEDERNKASENRSGISVNAGSLHLLPNALTHAKEAPGTTQATRTLEVMDCA